MNSELLIYLAKCSIVFSLLYITYKILFSKTTFFNLNRAYLLSLIPISLALPLVSFPSSSTTNEYFALLPEINIIPQVIESSENIQPLYLLVIISCMFIIRFLYRTVKILNYIQYLKTDNTTNINPFSFFNFIYIPSHIEEENKSIIIAHEQVHAKQLHSLDILLFELYKSIFWFNPFVWFALKDVKTNHEFIADDEVNKLNIQSYSKVLVAQLLGVNCSDLANNFNYEPLIKKRIKMMKTKKTKRALMAMYALIIPIGITAFISTTTLKVNAQNTKMKKEKIEGVDVMPQYKGGNGKMVEFIGQNINYPKDVNVEGKVFVGFVVNEKGKVTDVSIVKGLHEKLDKEAVRVISAMPNWTPGKKDGKAVSVKMTLPISYKLQ